MPPEDQPTTSPQAADTEKEAAARPPEVDLQALAREILALLKRELRLERERSGRD